MTVIAQNQLHFLGEGRCELFFWGLGEATDEIACVELGNGLYPADLAEIMENMVRDMPKGYFTPLLNLLQRLLQLFHDCLLYHILLLPLLAYLREHP